MNIAPIRKETRMFQLGVKNIAFMDTIKIAYEEKII